jgi:predicted nucleic-acid-binding Zn-ribbon protein
MAYQIRCLKCHAETWSGNIVDLIDAHTNLCGRLVCSQCGETETYVQQITGRWEKEPDVVWDEYIKGVIRVTPDSSRHTPYVFLTAKAPGGSVEGIRISYYECPGPNGRLADGPGPGQAPALTRDELRQLLVKLGVFGVIQAKELEVVAQLVRLDAPSYASAT